MEYGIIYLTVIPPKNHKLYWLKDFRIGAPKIISKEISSLASKINDKFSSDIVIKMDNKLHPGCLTTVDGLVKIATEMYNGFVDIFSKFVNVSCIRCVYTIGELQNINVNSVHNLDYYPVMIKIGRYLDSSDKTGIFRI